MHFAPVHTNLPEPNIKAAVLGSLSLNTNPGNCSKLYSTFSKAGAIFGNSNDLPNVADATMFSTFISTSPPFYSDKKNLALI